MRLALTLVSLAIVSAACTDAGRAPTATSGRPIPGDALAAKPVANPRATFAYFTVSATTDTGGRLIGDGLDSTGTVSAEPSLYADGHCDVSAEIFVSGSGDATMDPTGGSQTCSPPREVRVEFGRPVAPGSLEPSSTAGAFFTNVRDVLSVSAGQSPPAERRFRLLLRGFPDCDYLRYENEVAASIERSVPNRICASLS